MWKLKSNGTGYIHFAKLERGMISIEPYSESTTDIRPALVNLVESKETVTLQELFEFFDFSQLTSMQELIEGLRRLERLDE